MLLYNALLVISFAIVDKFVIMCIIFISVFTKKSLCYILDVTVCKILASKFYVAFY